MGELDAEIVFVPRYARRTFREKLAPIFALALFGFLLFLALRGPTSWSPWLGLAALAIWSATLVHDFMTSPRRLLFLGPHIVIESRLASSRVRYEDIDIVEPGRVQLLRKTYWLGLVENREEFRQALEAAVRRGWLRREQLDPELGGEDIPAQGDLEEDDERDAGREVLPARWSWPWFRRVGRLWIICLPAGAALAWVFILQLPPVRWATSDDALFEFAGVALFFALFTVRFIHGVRWREERLARAFRWSLWITAAMTLPLPLYVAHEKDTLRSRQAAAQALAAAWTLPAQPCALGVESGPRADEGLVGRWTPLDGGHPIRLEAEGNAYWMTLGSERGRRVALLGTVGSQSFLNVDSRKRPDDEQRWTWIRAKRDGDSLELDGLSPSAPPSTSPSQLCAVVTARTDGLQGNRSTLHYRRVPAR